MSKYRSSTSTDFLRTQASRYLRCMPREVRIPNESKRDLSKNPRLTNSFTTSFAKRAVICLPATFENKYDVSSSHFLKYPLR